MQAELLLLWAIVNKLYKLIECGCPIKQLLPQLVLLLLLQTMTTLPTTSGRSYEGTVNSGGPQQLLYLARPLNWIHK